MATTREVLEFLIDANVQGFVSGMDKAGAAAERELGKTDERLEKMAGRMTTWGAATFGAASVAAIGLGKLATMAGESEVAQAKLDSSIANSTQSFVDNGKALGDLADQLMGSTVVDDEAVKGVEALLIQFGYTEDQVLALTPLVVDLSRKMGVDLETAAKAVGRAAGGSTTALQRMGIQVNAIGEGSTDMERTISALQQTVGGFAQQEAQTFNGQLAILKNQLSEIGEQVGVGAASTLSNIVGAGISLTGALNDMNPGLSSAAGSLATISAIGAGGLGALSFATGQFLQMRDNLSGVFEKLRDTEGRLTGFGKAVAGIGAVGVGVAVTAALIEIGNSFNKGSQDAKAFTESLLVLQGVAKGNELEAFSTAVNANVGTLDRLSADIDGATDRFGTFGGAIRDAALTLLPGGPLISGFGDLNDQFGNSADLIAQFGEGASATQIDLNQLGETIDKVAESGSIPALESFLRQLDGIQITNPEQQAAVDAARAKTEGYIGDLKNAAGSQRNLDVETRKATEAARDQALASGKTADGLVEVTATAEDLKDIQGELTLELAKVTAEFDLGRAAAKGFARGYEVVTGDLQGIVDSAQGLGEAFKSFRTTTDEEGQTVAAVLSALPSEGFDPVAASLGGYTEAQNKAVDALQGWGDAVNKSLQAQIAAGATNEDVLASASNYEAFLRNYLIGTLGMSEEAARQYIETIGLTPEQVNTQILISGTEEAKAQLQFLQADFDNLPREVQSEIYAKVRRGEWDAALAVYNQFQDKQVIIGALFRPGTILGWFGQKNPDGTPRAIGGPVTAGETFMVGERGPELFVPETSGMIVPNNLVQDLSSSRQTSMTIGAINITESSDARLTAAEVIRQQRDAMFLAGV
jgi:hypothetical protein